MRLLIFACFLFAAESAPQQGYAPEQPGSTDISLATLSASDGFEPTGLILSVDSKEETPITIGVLPGQPNQASTSDHSSFESTIFSGESYEETKHDGTQATSQIGVSNAISTNAVACFEGQVLHVDGTCVTPEIERNVFLFTAPEMKPSSSGTPNIPYPKVEHNIVFIQTTGINGAYEPIVIPPPQKKHIIYVLNQQFGTQGPRVIQVPAPATATPEVYFVNYDDGFVPALPDGTDFETAIQSAVHSEGIVLGSSNNLNALDGGSNAFVGGSISGLTIDSIEDISAADYESSFESIIEDGIILAGAGDTHSLPALSGTGFGEAVSSGSQGASTAANTFQNPSSSISIGHSSPQGLYSTP